MACFGVHVSRTHVQLSECLDLANEMTSLKIKLTSRCFSALTLTLLRARRVPMVRPCKISADTLPRALADILLRPALCARCPAPQAFSLQPSPLYWVATGMCCHTLGIMSRQALEMIQRAVRQGAPVSAYTYASVVRLLARRTDFGAAEDLLANMAEAGCVPAALALCTPDGTSRGFLQLAR